jgi:hypothetical protein
MHGLQQEGGVCATTHQAFNLGDTLHSRPSNT